MKDSYWKLWFCFACWVFWRRRNQEVFTIEPTDWNANVVTMIAWKVKQFLEDRETLSLIGLKVSKLSNLVQKWNPPDLYWIKINTDSACVNGVSRIAYGGMIQDSIGHWVQGFVSYLGKGSVPLVELNGALKGLNLGWEMGLCKVWLKLDLAEGLEMIQQRCSFTHPYSSFIQKITDLLAKSQEVKFSYTSRE